MHTIAGLSNLADAVVNDQPAVPGEDRRRAAANFEALPRRHRTRPPLMRKLGDETWLKSFQGNRTVGNPYAFAIKIHLVGGGAAGFLRSGSRKQRPVKQGQLRLPRGIRNGSGEWAGSLCGPGCGI